MGTLIRDEIGAAEDRRYLPDTPGVSRAVTAFKNIEPTEPHRPEPAICWTGDTDFRGINRATGVLVGPSHS